MRKILLVSISFIFLNICFAQVTLPYYTGFDDVPSQEEWTQYNLGDVSTGYEWYFNSNALVHFYPVGGTEATNNWMVSPEFDFSNGAVIDSLKYKTAGFGYSPYNVDTIALYLINGAENPDEAGLKVLLKLFTDDDFVNDNMWKTFSNIEIPAYSGESHLAFQYQTVNNWFDVTIDDIYISEAVVGIEEVEFSSKDISIYPVPANNFIQWTIPDDININQVYLSDINGNKLTHNILDKHQISIDQFSNGLYFLNFETADYNYSKSLIIQ